MNKNLESFYVNSLEESVPLNQEQLASIDNMQDQIDKVQSPLQSLEHSLHGFVTYIIMPLFAFANAGIVLKGVGLSSMTSLTLSISSSLVLGKITGILLFSYLTVKLGISELPSNINWKHILGAAMLGGIGFTMSLFISSLAYTNEIIINQAKLGILIGSFVAAVIGFIYLKISISKNI
jgi:NhaA family Na+:H+ antiporter